MASEIKVDTISEKTSAGGVTIDGLLIKDGGISGDVSLIGTTPTFTIGDAGAEDAALVFDGNAQDFYIGLDDSADDLIIGQGSTVGTNPAISIDENQNVTIADGSIDFNIASHDTSNGLKLGGTLVSASAAERNILDGVTATAAEINLIDGGTARGTTAIADGDGVLINDAGTMRQTTVETLKTYIGGFDVSSITGATALTVDPASDDEYIINNGGTLNRVDYKHVSNSGKFMVYDAAVTVANATGTIVTGWSETYDVDGLFASNKYTPTVAGYYYLAATVRADNPGATARFNMGIRKNGSALPLGGYDAETNIVSASYPTVNNSAIVYADGDDYFEVHIYHNIGSSHDFFDVGFFGFKLS